MDLSAPEGARIRVLLVLGTMYSGNMGIVALTTSALSLLSSLASQGALDVEFTLLGTNKQEACDDAVTIGATNIEYRFEPFAKTAGIKAFPFLRYFRLVSSMDVVFDLGAGDGFTDLYGFKRFWNIVVMAKIMPMVCRKPIVMLPQTIGPFGNGILRSIANAILKRVDVVYARDKQSKMYLSTTITGREFRDTVDLAFALPYESSMREGKVERVGLNVSGLLWHGGRSRGDKFRLVADYRALVVKIIEYFETQDVELMLVGHVFTEEGNVEDDGRVNRILKERFPFVSLAPQFTSAIAAKSFISGCDFFVGSRMHACIAAFSAGVPVFPVGYSRKFTGLFVDTLGYICVGDATTDGADAILEKMKSAFMERGGLREVVRSKNRIADASLEFLKDDVLRHLTVWSQLER